MEYELMMGLETHVELNTRTKIFCGCPVRFGQPPNTDCCPVCIGMPGTLPVLNREVVHFGVLAGLALHCAINLESRMSRKHYFYPDLAKAYQITQQQIPLCEQGWLEQLQEIMRYLGISDGKMQEGSMRCDVNISVRPKGQGQMGERTEIKNMNSISYLIKAVEYEFQRQVELLERGGRISRETRRYDQKTGTTQLMRKKEDQTDYLYFEEPDIPPVVLSAQEVEEWGRELPELPMQKRKRYQEQGLSPQETAALVKYPKVAAYFEESCEWVQKPALAAKWMLTHLFSVLSTEGQKEEGQFPLPSSRFGEFLQGIETGTVRRNYAKEVLSHMISSGDSLKESLKKIQKEEMTERELEALCRDCLESHPEAVSDYLRGKTQAVKALIGTVMKASKGRANPQKTQILLQKLMLEKAER